MADKTQGSPQPWQVVNSGVGGNNPNRTVSASETDAETRAFRRSPGDNVLYAPPAPGAEQPVPTDPKGFQQYLKDHGANLGTSGPKHDGVDGVIGPKTLAAAKALNIPVPDTLAPAAPAQAAAPQSSGGAPPAPAGGQQPTSAAPAVPGPDQIIASMKAQYGYLGAILDRPDVSAALVQAVQEGLTDEQALARLYGTDTWNQKSAQELNWITLKPADQGAAIAKQSATINAQAKTLGVNLDPARLTQIATDAARNGWNPQQIQDAVAAEFHYQPGGQTSGQLGTAEASIRKLANDYLVPISDPTLADWDRQIAEGTATPESFRQYFIAQASGLYRGDGIAQALQGGATMQQLADPYRQDAANELGVNPESIDFTQPKWMKALSTTDPASGQPTMMGRSDWVKTLRSDPTYGWDQTPNGKNAYYQIGNALTSALGLRP